MVGFSGRTGTRDSREADELHPTIRRALRLLGASYALAWLCVAMVAGPGSAAYVALAGRIGDAGYFIAIYFVGAAAGGAVGGRLMDRFGRRPVLVVAHLISAAGFAASGAAVLAGSLPMFVAGVGLLAVGMGGVYLTRLAAAEIFPAARRGRGVAYIQLSAFAGAVIGPLLLVMSGPLGDAIGRDPLGLVWFVAPPLLVLAALLVAFAPETRTIARDLPAFYPHAPVAVPLPARRARRLHALPVVTGVVVLAMAQAAMLMAMGVTGAALAHEGHGLPVVGVVLSFHFLGMFGLSTFVGRAADRFGRTRTAAFGFGLIASGGAVFALVPGVPAFTLGIFLVGLGWSFGFMAATVLIADVTPVARSARVMGVADMVTAMAAAGASLAGGWVYADRGLAGLGLFAVALVILPALMALLLREPSPGVYGGVGPEPAEPAPVDAS